MTMRRLAILADYPEEGWPSMDLVAEMLARELARDSSLGLSSERQCPEFRHRMSRLSHSRGALNFDRLVNRMRDYPNFAKSLPARFDLFHVCDHSYSQLVHALPGERTGVFCHDLDTFRCILDPNSDRRPKWFRAMARRILGGFQKAAIVFHATREIRRQIERHALIDPSRLVHAPLGVADEFLVAESRQTQLPPGSVEPFVMHVGSCIARKRIDVLLDVFGQLASKESRLRLIQVGGQWTAAQHEQISRLNMHNRVAQLRGISRDQVAALYRRARIVLLPSAAEGFGLPLIEALACGTPVIASDISVLREVGADAAVYCPVGDVTAWVDAARRLLAAPSEDQRKSRIAQASQYTWRAHACIIADAYQRLGAS